MPGNTPDRQQFLVVNDKKDRDKPAERGGRVGVLTVTNDEGQRYVEVEIPDTEWGTRKANDLEAACRVPGSADLYLLMESSYFLSEEGDLRYGRVFAHSPTAANDAAVS